MADATQTAEQTAENPATPATPAPAETKMRAQTADFPEAVDTGGTAAGGSIDILLDMNVPVTVTVGKTQIPIRRLLQLAPGSVVKLNKPVDTPMDLYLKDIKFATGTVVVVDGRFAVKIKQVLSASEQKAAQPQQ